MLNYIKTLEQKFDIEIVRSSHHIKGKNYFDLDSDGNIIKIFLLRVNLRDLSVLLPIADHLVELAIRNCNIKSLKGLDSFSNLEVLDLRGNHLETSTLKNLSYLSKLKGLNVSGCKIEDTSYFQDLVYLEQLYVAGTNRLYEIKGLEQLINLKHLDVERSKIDCIKKIKAHENLRSLHITNTDVIKLSHFDRFPNLVELMMGGVYEMEKIEGLQALTNLKQLLIEGTSIKKIEGLEQLTNLEVLDLSANEISEIKGLEQLTKLRELNLNENKIIKVENLEGLNNLELLLLDANEIESFDPTFLQYLDSECHIYMRGFNKVNEVTKLAPQHVKINFEEDFPYPTSLVWQKSLFV